MTTTVSEPNRATRSLQDRPIIGHRKRQVLRDIALGELSLQEIAHKWSRSYQRMREIAAENKDEINEIKQQFDQDLNKVYLSSKFDRLKKRADAFRSMCEHQQQLELEAEETPGLDEEILSAVSEHWLRYEAAKQKILREIAEELGQLPQRAPSADTATALRVIHEIGVDTSGLFPVKELP